MALADDFLKDAGTSSAPANSLASQFIADSAGTPAVEVKPEEKTFNQKVLQQEANIGGGLIRGAGSIGATLLSPIDWAARKLNGGQPINIGGYDIAGQDRRTGMDAGLQSLGVDTNSLGYSGGKLSAEVAGTAGTGGLLANAAKTVLPAAIQAVPTVAKVISGLGSGGFNLGVKPAATLLGQAANLGIRAGTGAAVGGASAGMVDPNQFGMGAAIGGTIPVSGQLLGMGAGYVGGKLRGDAIDPAVAALAQKADQYGINIPADRLTNSKPLNAIASSLNYVPFSGRQAVEDGMQNQLNTAVSKSMGQTGDNVTAAFGQAKKDLGGQFDDFLKKTTVNFDGQLANDLGDISKKATSQLNRGDAKIISNQIDEIVNKAGTGQIEGQAAYNLKRDLDAIAKRNSPEAEYAKQLRNSLMGAMNRSLNPADQQAFSTLRQQYGNMKALTPLIQNGAQGDISLARMANMKNINNQDLQDLADISAQFLKPREGAHGSMQRAMVGGLSLTQAGGAAGGAIAGPIGYGLGAAAGLGVGAGLGKTINSALNSDWARQAILNGPNQAQGLLSTGAQAVSPLAYRMAGLLSAQ